MRAGITLLTIGLAFLALIPDGQTPIIALSVIVAGIGLFRSNIIAMVGRLYAPSDPRCQGGYRLLYAAFNLGAVLAPPLAGALAKSQRWRLPFSIAAAVMLVGVLLLELGRRNWAGCAPLSEVDGPADQDTLALPRGTFARWLAIGTVAQAALLWAVAYGPVDGSLLLWARDHTRRSLVGFEVPASVFASVPALLVLILSPILAVVDRRNTVNSMHAKLLTGLYCTSAGFALMGCAAYVGQRSACALWLAGCLALLALGEVLVVPITQSLICQVASRSRTATALGVWYGATAIGFWGSGQLGALWERWPKVYYFSLLALVPLVGVLLFRVQMRYLRRRRKA